MMDEHKLEHLSAAYERLARVCVGLNMDADAELVRHLVAAGDAHAELVRHLVAAGDALEAAIVRAEQLKTEAAAK